MRHALFILIMFSAGSAAQTNRQEVDRFLLYKERAAQFRAQAQLGIAAQPMLVDIDQAPLAFAWYLLSSDSALLERGIQRRGARAASAIRLDQQFGAGPGTVGAATVKSGIPEVLSSAFESGAVTRTVQGNAVTFTLNGENLYKFVSGQGFCDSEQQCSFLHDIAAYATFDTNTPATQSASVVTDPDASTSTKIQFLPDHRTLTGAGFQYAINNPNDPGKAVFGKRLLRNWAKYQSSRGTQDQRLNYQELAVKMLKSIPPEKVRGAFYFLYHPDFQAVVGREKIRLEQLREHDLRAGAQTSEGVTAQQMETLFRLQQEALTVDPNLLGRLAELLAKAPLMPLPSENVLRAANSGTAYSLRYNYLKPYNEAALHGMKAVVKFNPKGGPTLVTGNFGLDLFGGKPNWKMRDLQASVAVERGLGEIENQPATLSLAFYFQWQKENALLQFGPGNNVQGISLPGAAATLLAPRGKIYVTQAILTLKRSDTVVVPIGFTYSNRTELLAGSEIRGHVGLQFNYPSFLDPKPSNKK